MNTRYIIADNKKNAKKLAALRRERRLKNGQLPPGWVTEAEATRRSWDIYQKWITLPR